MDDDERGSKPGVAPCDDLNTGSPNPHLKLLATYVVLGYRLQNSLQAHSDPLLSLSLCSLTPSRLFFFFGSLFLDRFSLLRSNLFYDYYLIVRCLNLYLFLHGTGNRISMESLPICSY